jgi:hypothetical protein
MRLGGLFPVLTSKDPPHLLSYVNSIRRGYTVYCKDKLSKLGFKEEIFLKMLDKKDLVQLSFCKSNMENHLFLRIVHGNEE